MALSSRTKGQQQNPTSEQTKSHHQVKTNQLLRTSSADSNGLLAPLNPPAKKNDFEPDIRAAADNTGLSISINQQVFSLHQLNLMLYSACDEHQAKKIEDFVHLGLEEDRKQNQDLSNQLEATNKQPSDANKRLEDVTEKVVKLTENRNYYKTLVTVLETKKGKRSEGAKWE